MCTSSAAGQAQPDCPEQGLAEPAHQGVCQQGLPLRQVDQWSSHWCLKLFGSIVRSAPPCQAQKPPSAFAWDHSHHMDSQGPGRALCLHLYFRVCKSKAKLARAVAGWPAGWPTVSVAWPGGCAPGSGSQQPCLKVPSPFISLGREPHRVGHFEVRGQLSCWL